MLISILDFQAQFAFNVAFHDSAEVPASNVVIVHGDYYFLSTRSGFWANGGSMLNKYSSLGAGVFRMPFIKGVEGSGFKSLDNKLIFWGGKTICNNYDTSQIRGRIIKVDTNGTILFNAELNLFPNGGIDVLTAVLQAPDSSFFAFSDSVMFKLNKFGAVVTKTILSTKEIKAACLLPNGNILLSKGNLFSAGNVVTISQNGTVLNAKPCPKTLTKMHYLGQGKGVIGREFSGLLYKFTDGFDITVNSIGTFTATSDFLTDKDTIYAIGFSDFGILDTTFSLLSSSTSTVDQYQHRISKNENMIVSLAWRAYLPSQRLVSLHVFHKTSGNNFNEDVKLSTLTVDSVYAIKPNSFSSIEVFTRLKATVKNISFTTLNNFYLTWSFGYSFCQGTYFKKYYGGFSLSPGDSVTVITPFLKNYATSNYTLNGNVMANNVCLVVSVPNGRNESNDVNNLNCSTYTTVVTGGEEGSLGQININVYPNPVSDYFILEHSLPTIYFEVTNTLGKLMKSEFLNAQKTRIDCRTWTNGIYFLRVETEKGLVIKKVIKN